MAPRHLLAVDPILLPWLPKITLAEAEIVRKRGPLRLVRQPPPESLTATFGDRFRALVESVIPWY